MWWNFGETLKNKFILSICSHSANTFLLHLYTDFLLIIPDFLLITYLSFLSILAIQSLIMFCRLKCHFDALKLNFHRNPRFLHQYSLWLLPKLRLFAQYIFWKLLLLSLELYSIYLFYEVILSKFINKKSYTNCFYIIFASVEYNTWQLARFIFSFPFHLTSHNLRMSQLILSKSFSSSCTRFSQDRYCSLFVTKVINL